MHLHVVFWGGLTPHLLQAAALNLTLIEAVTNSIDLIIKAEVDPEFHVEHLLAKFNSRVQPKPALITPHHPIKEKSKIQ